MGFFVQTESKHNVYIDNTLALIKSKCNILTINSSITSVMVPTHGFNTFCLFLLAAFVLACLCTFYPIVHQADRRLDQPIKIKKKKILPNSNANCQILTC